MTTGNAIGFCVSGLGMWLLPSLVPALVARTGIDGTSARELWLQLMALVHGVIGAGYILRFEVVERARAWVARPAATPARWSPARVVALARPERLSSPEPQGTASAVAG